MMKRLLTITGVLITLLLAAPLPAPIIGHFPGTEEIVRRADAIVIADVGPLCLPDNYGEMHWQNAVIMRPANFGDHDKHEAEIIHVIKGTMTRNDCLLSLRGLGDGPPRKGEVDVAFPPVRPTDREAFDPPLRCLIFLTGNPPLLSMNCVGSITLLPTDFDPEVLKNLEPEEAVRLIWGDDVKEPWQPPNRSSWPAAPPTPTPTPAPEPKPITDADCECDTLQIVPNKAPPLPTPTPENPYISLVRPDRAKAEDDGAPQAEPLLPWRDTSREDYVTQLSPIRGGVYRVKD